MMEKKLLNSFGRRKGRVLRVTASHLYHHVLPQLLLPLAPINVEPLFKKSVKEIWLEIGFGGGEHLAAQLEENQDVGIIGCEPYINGITKLLGQVDEENYNRLRVFKDDVRLLLPFFSDQLISKVFILFPDPWPKKRHYKRRLISANLLRNLIPLLKEGAEVRVASDDVSYVEQILEVFSASPSFFQQEGPKSCDLQTWNTKPSNWKFQTRYEEKAQAAGRKCAYLSYIYRK